MGRTKARPTLAAFRGGVGRGHCRWFSSSGASSQTGKEMEKTGRSGGHVQGYDKLRRGIDMDASHERNETRYLLVLFQAAWYKKRWIEKEKRDLVIALDGREGWKGGVVAEA